MTAPDPSALLAEADALEALEKRATALLEEHKWKQGYPYGERTGEAGWFRAFTLLDEFRNRALPLIRVLRAHYDAANKNWDECLTRIAALEAEVQLERERGQAFLDQMRVADVEGDQPLVLPPFTTAEIGARVAMNRKERTR